MPLYWLQVPYYYDQVNAVHCCTASAYHANLYCLCHCCTATQVPYYYDQVNAVWSGLWAGILYTTVLLVVLDYTQARYEHGPAQELYRHTLTWVRRQLQPYAGASG
jgi:hypothetical protein